MDKDAVISIVKRLLNDPEQIFVLSTLTEDGYPDSRLMGNICQKSIDEIYFTCQTGTRKINELAKNSKTNVYFNSGMVNIWLYGDANTTRDESVRKKIWNDKMLPIYAEGVDSPRLTVIRFVPVKVRFQDRAIGREYIEFDL